jgi:DNA polymerase
MDPRSELHTLVQTLKKEVARRKTTFLTHGRKQTQISSMDNPSFSPEEKLRHLRDEEIGDCQRCPLGATRIKLAFGVGNPRAHVLWIGEGPGYKEDRQGEPFVGPAGQLLDKMLASIELSRQKTEPDWKWVYIANMVKCHPMIDPLNPDQRGNDRPPTEAEMAVCSPFLMKQIQIIRPRFLVALGATATRGLLKTSQDLKSLRGHWFDFHPDGDPALSIRLMPMFHPAALLRSPSFKTEAWEHLKIFREELRKTV